MSKGISPDWRKISFKLGAGLAILAWGPLAAAASYNIVLKFPDATNSQQFLASTCATGGFVFDKDTTQPAGGYLPDSISVEVDTGCLADIEAATLATQGDPLPTAVQVVNIVDNGLNVSGLAGVVTGSAGGFVYNLQFSFPDPTTATPSFDAVRTFVLTKVNAGDPDDLTDDIVVKTIEGRYYVVNTVNLTAGNGTSIPEPTTLTLLGGAALGLWFTQRRRRR